MVVGDERSWWHGNGIIMYEIFFVNFWVIILC